MKLSIASRLRIEFLFYSRSVSGLETHSRHYYAMIDSPTGTLMNYLEVFISDQVYTRFSFLSISTLKGHISKKIFYAVSLISICGCIIQLIISFIKKIYIFSCGMFKCFRHFGCEFYKYSSKIIKRERILPVSLFPLRVRLAYFLRVYSKKTRDIREQRHRTSSTISWMSDFVENISRTREIPRLFSEYTHNGLTPETRRRTLAWLALLFHVRSRVFYIRHFFIVVGRINRKLE